MQEPPAIAGGERALESAGTFQSLARVNSQGMQKWRTPDTELHVTHEVATRDTTSFSFFDVSIHGADKPDRRWDYRLNAF
jgi:hypothetical protein